MLGPIVFDAAIDKVCSVTSLERLRCGGVDSPLLCSPILPTKMRCGHVLRLIPPVLLGRFSQDESPRRQASWRASSISARGAEALRVFSKARNHWHLTSTF